MSQRSQPERVLAFLSAHPRQKFKASDIANGIIAMFPEDYRAKRSNSRFVKGKLPDIG